ncbi:hypothetical protein F383_22631 [Gossypium arboreum]|nr:hypothetical protein F383_22631 [Gossypium arboreum]
MCQIEFT